MQNILGGLVVFAVILQTGTAVRNKLRDVDWFSEGQMTLQKILDYKEQTGIAKNVILFVGDGMGISTSTAARVLKAQQEGKSLFHTKLAWDEFPYSAISMPYNVDQLTSDSAAGATALLSGTKTNHGVINYSSKTIRKKCETEKNGQRFRSILQHSHDNGKWTGVVTNTRITHATPAATYAATAEREWESDERIPEGCKDIAAQLVEDNHFIKVVLGGGRVNFLPSNETDPVYTDQPGTRADGRDLMELWKRTQEVKSGVGKEKTKLVTNQKDFNAVDANHVEYLMGLFEPGHMHFEVDRENSTLNKDPEPSMADMTEKALRILKKNKKGFFLLVEGGRIDHGHHNNNAYRALTDTLAFSEAVQRATQMTSETDTLIVVTADHSHTFTINGYSHPDSDILGLSRSVITGKEDELELQLSQDDMPYLTLSYGNGRGFMYHRTNGSLSGITTRRNLTEDWVEGKTMEKDYVQDGLWPIKSESHAGEDVGLHARGPMAHLFRGLQEQSNMVHIMMYASCVGPNKNHCRGVSNSAPASLGVTKSNYLVALSLVALIRKKL